MKRQRGFVLPVSLCVAGVVLFLGASTAQIGAGDLKVSNHLFYQERARQVADFALEAAQVQNSDSNGDYQFSGVTGSNSHDIGRVQVYDNRTGTLPANSGCPVQVPVGYQYWVATGEARNDSDHVLGSVRLGALVRFGLPVGAAGAQVKYLSGGSLTEPVTYRAVDQDNMPLPDRVLCATDATTDELPVLNPTNLIKPVTLRAVDAFDGKVRIPQGASQSDIVQVNAPTTVAVDSAGGLFNIPNYSPPLPTDVFATHIATAGFSNLPPGFYQEVVLRRDATLNLNGSYHFKKLRLDSSGSGTGTLRVGNTGAANVYVDEIESPSGLELGLRNAQPQSNAFRLHVKPAGPGADDLTLQVAAQASGEGGLGLVAPKYNVRVVADASRIIRGSFACESLSLDFQAPTNFASNATFVYDASLDTTRKTVGQRSGVIQPYEAVDQPMIMSKQDL